MGLAHRNSFFFLFCKAMSPCTVLSIGKALYGWALMCVSVIGRSAHAAESGHIWVQREMWLQTEAGVHETNGQTVWPVHSEYGRRDRSAHAVCEGEWWTPSECLATDVEQYAVSAKGDDVHSVCRNASWDHMEKFHQLKMAHNVLEV